MKILFVTPPPYLPNRLHRIRAFDFIRILAKKYEVHLLSVTTHKNEQTEFKEIKKVCKSINIVKINPLKAFINILRFPLLPYEVAYCYSKDVTYEIENIIKTENMDMLYLKRLRSAIYLPAKLEIPVILDTTDAMSMFYQRLSKGSSFPKKIIYKLEEIKYKVFEQQAMKKIKNWIVCSLIDKKYLQGLGRNVNAYVIPNPVDTNFFSVAPAAHLGGECGNALLFRGIMDKPVNIDACLFFVKEILPKVKKGIKDVKLFIVGPNPTPSVLNLHDGKSIFVTGYVKDVRDYIRSTAVSVCPIRIGSGTRHKILQAWSMGRPVVSTTLGAEGLLYKKDKNIAIADSPKEFAKQIISLLKNKMLYGTLAKNGRKTVEREYSFKVIAQKLEKVIWNVKAIK